MNNSFDIPSTFGFSLNVQAATVNMYFLAPEIGHILVHEGCNKSAYISIS